MKRRNRLLFALALIAGIMLTALAALAEPGGSCGPNLTWSFLDGVMAVEGSGAMKDGAFWKEQVQPQEIEQVIVGDGVTRIGEEAFQGCENLKMV